MMTLSSTETVTPSKWLAPEASPGSQRGIIPHGLARSALFAGIPPNSRRRVFSAEEKLASWDNVAIYQCSGKQLTQHEGSVWLELIRIAMHGPTPATGQTKVPVHFTGNGLLRALNPKATPDSESRQRLLQTIEMIGNVRIRVASLENGIAVESCTTNLIDVADLHRGNESYYKVYFDVSLAQLFAGNRWSYISLSQRYALKNNALAQWLHTHYSTHREPYAIGHEKLKILAGREATREDKWLKTLRQALDELATVTKWKCTLSDKGVVSVKKGNVLANTKPKQQSIAVKELTSGKGNQASDPMPEEYNEFFAWLGSQSRFTLHDICAYYDALPENGRLSDIELRDLVRKLWVGGISVEELIAASLEI